MTLLVHWSFCNLQSIGYQLIASFLSLNHNQQGLNLTTSPHGWFIKVQTFFVMDLNLLYEKITHRMMYHSFIGRNRLMYNANRRFPDEA